MKIPNRFFLAIAAFVMLVSACAPTESPPMTPKPNPLPSPSSDLAKSKVNREARPSISAADMQTLVDNNNAFAFDLYRSLPPSDANRILSPFSISLALAMTYAGARGETEAQMARVLHFSGQNVHTAFNALDLELSARGQVPTQDLVPLQLNIANAVWAEQTYPFRQEFLDTLALNYGAGMNLADFKGDYEVQRARINLWVEKQTREKIKDLLAKGTLNANTRMVLVNAIYFKADWLSEFDPNATHDAPFHLLDGSETQVKMMGEFFSSVPYASGDGYQAIELPYASETAAMTILVPDEGSFANFESTLDEARLNEILGAMQPSSVQLGLPKFKFESLFSLPDQLSAMGMPDAFDPALADFSGMTDNRDLFISDIIHKAFVAVDEKGTEAAAATISIMEQVMAPVSNITLTIERPFIFLIRDTVSGQILFMGRVVNPAQ